VLRRSRDAEGIRRVPGRATNSRATTRRARKRTVLLAELVDARQSLVALAASAVTSLVAGMTLGAAAGRLGELPGLLLMIPAAIGLRGNIFGSLGSRLGTATHAGTLRMSWRPDTVLGQNVLGAAALTMALSVLVAVLAKGVAVVFHVTESIPLADFVVISVVGGLLASVVILGVTLLVAIGSVRFDWDMDDVSAPTISTFSDVLTVPALLVGTLCIGHGAVTGGIALASVVASAVAVVVALRSRLRDLARIVRESLPVLSLAAVLSLIAGATVQARQESFLQHEALLVLLPGFLATAGALGGILSSRLATKFHLGLVEPGAVPPPAALRDMRAVFVIAVPIFAFSGLISHVATAVVGWSSPGIVDMLSIAVVGGVLATVFVVTVAWFSTMASFRFGLDPDSVGIPVVTSVLDLVGSFALILIVVAVGAS
jgi:mgtE-like transporter